MHGSFDVVVVGGGHAGAEAATAAARAGARVLLVTPDLARMGEMSCNPAIGGIAKGTVVREVDAAGGVMGRAADATRIHFRMLNRSKGPAVWGPRAQCDRGLYARAVRRILEEHDGIRFLQDRVVGLGIEGGRCRGVRLAVGGQVEAAAVVLTTGTFLRGRIHVGTGAPSPGGRAGEPASEELSGVLEGLGMEVGRFKTGTPPRIDGRTVDFSRLERQDGEEGDFRFSWTHRESIPEQRPCWKTWTGSAARELVLGNLARSALHGGGITGRGPRYCPSIEDKVVRFPEAGRHLLFLEPEGLDTSELYVNGLSTSLPPDLQLEILRSIPGLEEVRMTRPGYAIEYDFVSPLQLRSTLEARALPGLFLAGQINGTTGYEEAAGQGMVAGLNAGRAARGREPVRMTRAGSYIGVMIDDLVSRGVDEPYRLFTSRSEHRLLLRQDNALTRIRRELPGLAEFWSEGERARWEGFGREVEAVVVWLRNTVLPMSYCQRVLERCGADGGVREGGLRASELLERKGVTLDVILGDPAVDAVRFDGLDEQVLHAAEVEIRYAGYLRKEEARALRTREKDGIRIPEGIDWQGLLSLRKEARERLARAAPDTLAEALAVQGITAADAQNLVLEIRRRGSAQP